MALAGIVEGRVVGTRLKYIRLLSDEEILCRKKLESSSSITSVDKGTSTAFAHTRMGCYQQPLREVHVASDIFGDRYVQSEGDFAFKCWTHFSTSL